MVGNAASALCIVRFLALVISPSATVLTPKDITKRKIFDYGLSFGLPLLAMAMHVVFQPTRYAVSQITGCIGTAVHTWPFYFVYVLWIPLLFFAAAITSSKFVVTKVEIKN